MKKLILLFLIIPLILASCQKEITGKENIIYDINSPISSIDINWDYGSISFVDNESFYIEEKTNNEGLISKPLNYKISNDKLTINYGNKKNENYYKDLVIYYNFDCLLSKLNIDSVNIDAVFQNQSIDILYVNTKLITLEINNCDINFLALSGQTKLYTNGIMIEKSCIINTIINSNFGQLTLVSCSFNNLQITSVNTNIKIDKSTFNSLDIYNLKGHNDIWLNGNIGFNMNIMSKTYDIDFETVNYNNKYYYLDGSIPIKIYSEYGDTQIRRFFK